jgi:copper transport protein
LSGSRARSIRLFLLVICLAGVGLAAAAPRAFAANQLESSSPADGSTVTAPGKIQFFFTENTSASQLRVLLEGQSGAIETGAPAGDDENTISVALPKLDPGQYSASWRVGAAGGLSGAIRFTVSAQAATTTAAPATTVAPVASTVATTVAPSTTASSGPSDTSVVNGTSPAQALARFVAEATVLVLVGAYLVLLLAWPAGLDDPMTPRLLQVLALAGVIATLVVLLLAPDGAGDALSSLSGKAMAVRLVLLVIATVLLFLPGRADDAGRRDALIGSLLATLVTFPFAAHGARVRLEALGVVIGTLHVAGVAVFLGGLFLVARVLLVVADGETALAVLRRITRLFSVALGVIVVSGLIDGWRLVGSPGDLFSTWHGRLLLLKTVVTVVIVGLWLGLRDVIDNGLRRMAYVSDRMRARLARAVSLEVLACLVAVLLTAFLVGYRPAAAGKGTGTAAPSGISVELTGSRFNAHVTIEPGAVGINRMTVKIDGDTTGVTGFTLRLLPVGMEVPGIAADLPVPKGNATVPIDNVPISSAGQWRIELAPIGDATGGTLSNTFEIPGTPVNTTASTTTTVASASTTVAAGTTTVAAGTTTTRAG